ncbi:MAG: thioredoxin family protein [Bacteroidales bacterium]|jgi:thiol-disulfide isomerase/thioredoxin|nr:thioredoxin family protein [Bacteroidales bacterium]
MIINQLIIKNIILGAAFCLISNSLLSQSDSIVEPIIVGETSLEQLLSIDNFRTEFEMYYSQYQLDTEQLEKITTLFSDYQNQHFHIVAIVGSWCGDTKEQLPILLKILSATALKDVEITYIAVNRDKKAGQKDVTEYAVERIPIFLFYANEQLLGKIVETPRQSMEKDIIEIFRSMEN